MIIEQRIKKIRNNLNLNQEEFGKRIGIAKSTVSCYENGKRKPQIEVLESISETYNIDINYILGNDAYEISETNETYKTHISQEEITFVKEIRKYKKVHNMVIENPKRCAELINKKIY